MDNVTPVNWIARFKQTLLIGGQLQPGRLPHSSAAFYIDQCSVIFDA